ncbi:unnamed protein product, partial [Effrenium voratum]
MAMVGDGAFTPREGPSVQQKMMRQRQLVLKRQTDAAKSFGVVAPQHIPASDTPRQVPGWKDFVQEAPSEALPPPPAPAAPAVGIAGLADALDLEAPSPE